MEFYDGWSMGGGENDNRRYLVTCQNLNTMLIESQRCFIGESVVRNVLDLSYSQLKSVREFGFVDINDARYLVVNMY